MNNKEFLSKLIDILADANNEQIDIYEIDDTHNFKCVGTRKMNFNETLEFIIDKLCELRGELLWENYNNVN